MKRVSTFAQAGLHLAVSTTGDGRPMVFQHGLCGDAAQPAQVFPDDAGYQCITLECRGHGRSEAGPFGDLSIATFTDDLAALIVERGLVAPVVGGISMGAAIALRLAVTHPALVGALVLARPAWMVAPAPPNMAPNAEVGHLLRDHPPDQARALFAAATTAARLAVEAPDNLASLMGFFGREPVATTAALLTRISADGPGVSEGDLAALRVPTLVIGHQRDAVHPMGHARWLAATIPGARFVEITPKADDPIRYRDNFQAALAVFLSGL